MSSLQHIASNLGRHHETQSGPSTTAFMPKLIIGNKHLSSWSLRAYLALDKSGLPYTLEVIPLDTPSSKQLLQARTPIGKVPVLELSTVTIWESLAICEYLAERVPGAKLWPDSVEERAMARSISNEIHSSFVALRRELPMNIGATLPLPELSEEAKQGLTRMLGILEMRLEQSSPFLFGDFCIADAMVAPMITRFTTYGVPLSAEVQRFSEDIYAWPAMSKWIEQAVLEK